MYSKSPRRRGIHNRSDLSVEPARRDAHEIKSAELLHAGHDAARMLRGTASRISAGRQILPRILTFINE
jgi:hypothetical protein